MHNRITTPRIIVSPKAVAVAAVILPLAAKAGRRRQWLGLTAVTLDDSTIAQQVRLAPDTVTDALRELRRIGAITYSDGRAAGDRTVQVDSGHWVWAAVTAVTATVVPPVLS